MLDKSRILVGLGISKGVFMKKAIIYGAGNIGRGFIGALLNQSGYEVVFIDVSQPLVKQLNESGRYTVRLVSNDGLEEVTVSNVRAIDGMDTDAIAEAIAGADLAATAVGVNVLGRIAPNLAAGIRRRFVRTEAPLDIIICENLLDADRVLAHMIRQYLTEPEQVLFSERIGLVEASIGRMVPLQTEQMRVDDPLCICTEAYAFLPVDRAAFRGEIPSIDGLVPYAPFGYYIQRKLFLHNMGHAVCAYLGLCFGYTYIFEAVEDQDILILVKNAMLESMLALGVEYGVSPQALMAHVEDLLLRFQNRALADTCARVGQDPIRKLSENDRLIGAMHLCLTHDIEPYCISFGAAAALYRYLRQKNLSLTLTQAEEALRELSGLEPESRSARLILPAFEEFTRGTSPKMLRRAADELRRKYTHSVV